MPRRSGRFFRQLRIALEGPGTTQDQNEIQLLQAEVQALRDESTILKDTLAEINLHVGSFVWASIPTAGKEAWADACDDWGRRMDEEEGHVGGFQPKRRWWRDE